jgi:hypothetical protein
VLKKAHNPRQLLDGDLGINPRRILQVHARIVEQRGHLLLPGNQRPQPLVRRCELALHQRERPIRARARIVVRILLQGTNRFQSQQLRADVREHNLPVTPRNKIRRGRIRMNRLNALFKIFQRGNLAVDILARVVLQLRIILVIAHQRPVRRSVVKVHLVKVLVGNSAESIFPGLLGRVGSYRRHANSNRKRSCKPIHLASLQRSHQSLNGNRKLANSLTPRSGG